MKKCSKCEIEKEEIEFWKRNNRSSGVSSECKLCASERRTKKYSDEKVEFRKRRKEYYEKNKKTLIAQQVGYQKKSRIFKDRRNEKLKRQRKAGDPKFIARMIVCLALRGKMIVRPKICERCECEAKIEAHHSDYLKPLEILWVCRSCHMKIHKEEKEK